MNILGWFLAVCGLAGLVFGLRMMLKSKKMNTVPFKKPSDIAANGAGAADAKGMVSTEGAAQLPPQPLVAPKKARAKAKTPGEKAPALADWLAGQQSGGRRT